jgi:nucleoside phosphorylase
MLLAMEEVVNRANAARAPERGDRLEHGQQADVLILTALPRELEAVRSNAGPWTLEHHGATGVDYYLTRAYPGLTIAACVTTRTGPVSAVNTTVNALTALRPKRLLLVGICAGLAPQVKLGDVCVSDQIVDYDIGKIHNGTYTPRWRVYPADIELIRAARHHTDHGWTDTILTRRPDGTTTRPAVHIGTVLSGGKVVADIGFRDTVRRAWAEAIGLEMEAGGAASAAHEHATRPTFTLIKGVCDYATSAKNDRWQTYAADAAGRYAIALLLERHGLDRSPATADPPHEKGATCALCAPMRSDLLTTLTSAFDLRELRRLCFELGLDWDEIPDREVRSTAAMSIIEILSRRNDLFRLICYVRRERPSLFNQVSALHQPTPPRLTN